MRAWLDAYAEGTRENTLHFGHQSRDVVENTRSLEKTNPRKRRNERPTKPSAARTNPSA
jgi:hypothetical protein